MARKKKETTVKSGLSANEIAGIQERLEENQELRAEFIVERAKQKDKKKKRPRLPEEKRHELVKFFQQRLLETSDPVLREIFRGEFISELSMYDVHNPARVVKAAEQAIGNVSETDRQPIEGDPLNSIRALPDNPAMTAVTAAILQAGALLTGSVYNEHQILAHRRTAIQLLKARHVAATEIVDRTFKPLLAKARTVPGGEDQQRNTDQAYAEELSRTVGENIKYRPGIKTGIWYVYDGMRWAPSDGGGVIPMVTAMARQRYLKAAESKSTDERLRMMKEALHLESLKVAQNIVGMAATLPELRATSDDFDLDPYLLNVQNGTVNLRTGELRKHERSDLLTKLIPIEYDPQAGCPVFEGFLNTIFDGDAERIAYVQRAAGYTLTGVFNEQVMFIATGTGSNGKTTFLNAIQSVMGPYAVKMSASTLLASKNGGDAARNDVSTLEGCRLAACSESGLGRRLNEEWVKELTGGEKIKAKKLYLDLYEVDPTWKIWLATNHKPSVRGTDHAIWRRLKVIPFNVTIPDEAQDKGLPDKLLTELPGILAWMVRGCLEWQRCGLMEPKVVSDEGAKYRQEMDFVATFIDECCVIEPDAWVPTDVLYQKYSRWAEESREPQITKRMLSDRLAEKGFIPRQATTGNRAKGWSGLRIVTTWEPGPGGSGGSDGTLAGLLRPSSSPQPGPLGAARGTQRNAEEAFLGKSPKEGSIEDFTENGVLCVPLRSSRVEYGEIRPDTPDIDAESHRESLQGLLSDLGLSTPKRG